MARKVTLCRRMQAFQSTPSSEVAQAHDQSSGDRGGELDRMRANCPVVEALPALKLGASLLQTSSVRPCAKRCKPARSMSQQPGRHICALVLDFLPLLHIDRCRIAILQPLEDSIFDTQFLAALRCLCHALSYDSQSLKSSGFTPFIRLPGPTVLVSH